jgi:hypothetical protein
MLMSDLFSIEDKSFIVQNANDFLIYDFVAHFQGKFSKKQLKNYLNRNHIQYRKLSSIERATAAGKRGKNNRQRQQTPINHDFFKKWSKEMAYVFGLWCADGYISSKRNNYCFSIKLHKKDKYLLEQILLLMDSQHTIYENKDESCLFCIGSKTIVFDIQKIGGKERKSLDLAFPIIPAEFMKDFIRGYFDGDGCISVNKTKGCPIASISSGSLLFLSGLLNAIRTIDNSIKGGIYKNNNNPDSHTYKISFGKKDTVKFGKIIYANSPTIKLMRKYYIYLTAINSL